MNSAVAYKHSSIKAVSASALPRLVLKPGEIGSLQINEQKFEVEATVGKKATALISSSNSAASYFGTYIGADYRIRLALAPIGIKIQSRKQKKPRSLSPRNGA